MKIILIIGTLCAIFALSDSKAHNSSTTGHPDLISFNNEKIEDCNKEFNVTMEEYMTTSREMGTTPKNCYLKCVHEKMKFLQRGEYNLEELLESIGNMQIFEDNTSELRKALEECVLSSFSTDQCEYARLFSDCLFLDKSPKEANHYGTQSKNNKNYY